MFGNGFQCFCLTFFEMLKILPNVELRTPLFIAEICSKYVKARKMKHVFGKVRSFWFEYECLSATLH